MLQIPYAQVLFMKAMEQAAVLFVASEDGHGLLGRRALLQAFYNGF